MTGHDILKAIALIKNAAKSNKAFLERMEMLCWINMWVSENGDALGILEDDERSIILAILLKALYLKAKTEKKKEALNIFLKEEFGLNTLTLMQYSDLPVPELIATNDRAAILVRMSEGMTLKNLKDEDLQALNRVIFQQLVGGAI